MKIATWNVNGIRARAEQFGEWVERDRPDIICLQELKAAPEQIPDSCKLEGFQTCWHGQKGYSGVSLMIRDDLLAEEARFVHPPFDFETRVVYAEIGDLVVASIYLPNGGKDYDAKLGFLESMASWAESLHDEKRKLILCGDMNVARADIDVHPKERKKDKVGQRDDERSLFNGIIDAGFIDTQRHLEPDNENLFTWWAPWRKLRERNIGWRIDYILASKALLPQIQSCKVFPEVGTSDHAPLVLEINR